MTTKRISENPDNFQIVFDLAAEVGSGVLNGAVDVVEGAVAARASHVGVNALKVDLQSRIVDSRINSKRHKAGRKV
jgi:hypothetical protein